MRTLLRVWRQPRRSLKSAPGGSGAATPASVIRDPSSYFGGVQSGKRYLTARTCSCQLIEGAGLRRGSDQESSLIPFAKGCHAALERGLNSRSRRKQFRQGLGSQQLSCGQQVWGFEDGERVALGCLPYAFCDSCGHGRPSTLCVQITVRLETEALHRHSWEVRELEIGLLPFADHEDDGDPIGMEATDREYQCVPRGSSEPVRIIDRYEHRSCLGGYRDET